MLRTCLLSLLVVVAVLLQLTFAGQCTLDDFRSTFTPCDETTNLKYVAYYKIRECAGGVDPPIANVSLPCDISCRNGQFLAPPLTRCASCPAGSSSFAGTRLKEWAKWPSDMSTSCAPVGSCSPWRTQDTFIDSGEQKDQHNVISVLTYLFEIVVPQGGYISFEYKVDSERNWDGLEFFVDGKRYLSKEKNSNSLFYVPFRVSVGKGYHKVEWHYSKDSSGSMGLDRAFIRSIEVYGTVSYQQSCQPCPLGTSSSEGTDSCAPCKENTFSNSTGSSQCIPCPDSYYSKIGATQCIPRPVCTENDYVGYYTPCINGKRSIEYKWKEPRVCMTNLEKPSPTLNQPCGSCLDGLARIDPTQPDVCVGCLKGYHLDSKSSQCVACEKGYAAIRSLNYDNFIDFGNQLPSGWKSECGTSCSSGWKTQSDITSKVGYLEVGGPNSGEGATLSLDLKLYMRGTVRIVYSLIANDTGKSTTAFLVLVLNGNTILAMLDTSMLGKDGKAVFETQPIEPGIYSLSIGFEKFDMSDDNSRAMIYSLQIKGDTRGGSSQCSPCPAGYYCEPVSDEFKACPRGTYSNPESSYCPQCMAGSYADELGTVACKQCGPGTVPNTERTLCENTCTYNVPGTFIVYNLKSLDRPHFGPFKLPNSNYEHYFSLCQRMNTNFTDFCKAANPATRDYRFMETYACTQNKQQSAMNPMLFDTGHTIGFRPLSVQQRGNGLTVEMIGTSKCLTSADPMKTVIHFACNPQSAGKGQPVVIPPSSGREPLCTMEYKWESNVACPICTRYDFDSSLTSCKDGIRKKVFFWLPNSNCHQDGSVQLPQEQEFTCAECTNADYSYLDTVCKDFQKTRKYLWNEPRNCSNGVELPANEVLSCGEVAVQKEAVLAVLGLVSVIALLMILLLLCVCFLYRKNQQLHSQYSLVSEQQQQKRDFEIYDSDGDSTDSEDNQDQQQLVQLADMSHIDEIAQNRTQPQQAPIV